MNDTFLDQNPFAKAIQSKNTDADKSDIYSAVGYALHEWESLEATLNQLFLFLSFPDGKDNPSYESVHFAIGAIFNANTKRTMMERVAASYFNNYPVLLDAEHKTNRQDVNRLLKLYKQAASRRNEIAHGMTIKITEIQGQDYVVQLVTDENDGQLASFEGVTRFFHGPSTSSLGKRDLSTGAPSYRMSSEDINRMGANFAELSMQAKVTTFRLFRAHQEYLSKHAEQLTQQQMDQHQTDPEKG